MIRSPRGGPHGDLARTPSDAGGGAGRTHRRAGRRDQAHQHDRRAVGQRAEAADRGRRAVRPRDHDRRRVRLRGEGPRARAELPGRAVSDVGIHPVSGALGAEISGVDLSNALDDQTLGVLRRAWLEHLVLLFRDQPLTPPQFLGFARRFGEIIEYPFVKGLEEYPEIIPVVKLEHERINFGGVWHSDTAYLDVPPMASMLLAREVPPVGGDTLFANMYLAYETLSDGMKRLIDGLRAIHSDRLVAGPQSRASVGRSTKARHDDAWRETVSTHPMAIRHPETGRKARFVNVSYTVGIEGLAEDESRPLLDFLMEHGNRPEFTCRFRWTQGAVAFWDNRCVKHLAINDAGPFRRVMRRVQIA